MEGTRRNKDNRQRWFLCPHRGCHNNNLTKRILIVVPGHLKDQWRRELKDRFEENFVTIDRGLMDAHYAENVWERENQIITSMDFAKREEIIASLAAVTFDLIIVDEAHKMSAYRY